MATTGYNPLYRINAGTPFLEGVPNSRVSKEWYRFFNTTQTVIATIGNISISGDNSILFDTTGPTEVTLPESGTLATLAGNETLTNKTLGGATGAPFEVGSAIQVPNLNASQLEGATWEAPPALGGTTPNAVDATTLTSTIATGTPPITVSSTTVCALLNVGYLAGANWSAPNPIGAGTPNTGAFTTLSASGLITPTSTIGIQGTTTNDAPQAGCVGEVFDFLGTAVSLTTATPKTVLTEVLQAGDYEISCSVYFTVSSAASLLAAGVSFTTNTFLAAPYFNAITAASGSPFSNSALPSGPSTLRCAGPTSVFVIAQANFSAGTVTGTPQLHVRRAR